MRWTPEGAQIILSLPVRSRSRKPGHRNNFGKRSISMEFLKYRNTLVTGHTLDDRTMDSHAKRVRKKFKESDDSFDMIDTLYGVVTNMNMEVRCSGRRSGVSEREQFPRLI